MKKPGDGSKIWAGYYDIVIVPPVPVQQYAIQLSRRLQRLGGNWALGRRAFIPHISLYHIPVRDQDFPPFLAELEKILPTTSPGTLEITGFDMPVLQISKPGWLSQLHRKIVRRTAKYFDRTYGAEETWDLGFFKGLRRELAKRYLQEYGTPMYGVNFRPHITLTSFGNKSRPNFQPDLEPMPFQVNSIIVCELGESHSCQRRVASLPWSGL